MNSTPRVSVIVPSYNTSSTIVRAIESVLATRYPDLEIVIVDDGSTDDSLEVISALAENSAFVKVLTHEAHRNRGIAKTRNHGILSCSGRYVAFLDADDTFLPNRFDHAIKLLEEDSAVNVVYEPYRLVPVSGERAASMAAAQTQTLRTSDTEEDPFFEMLHHGGWPHTSSVTIRRTALIEAGMFPPLRYCLEKPLWLKLYAMGGVRAGGSEAVSCYFLHSGSTCAIFENTAAFRFEEVQAYLDVCRWMAIRGMDSAKSDAVKARAMGKYLHYTTYAWSLKVNLWRDILFAPVVFLRANPDAAVNRHFWWATLRMFLGRSPADQ